MEILKMKTLFLTSISSIVCYSEYTANKGVYNDFAFAPWIAIIRSRLAQSLTGTLQSLAWKYSGVFNVEVFQTYMFQLSF